MFSMKLFASFAALLASRAMAQEGMFVLYSPGGDDTAVERIDPVITPGKISGHVHQVFGGSGLSNNVDYNSLRSASCSTVGSADGQTGDQDKSLYWHPALYMEASDGSGYVRVPTNGHRIYYLDIGTGEKSDGFNFPKDFRMIAGNPFSRAALSSDATGWYCYNGGATNEGSSGAFPTGVSDCSDYPYFMGRVEFPHCWNGQDFDPEDPTAHTAYPDGDIVGGACPSSHPTRLPHIRMENLFDISSVVDKVKPDSFVLAQGDNTGYGWHADFYNGWEDGAIGELMSSCPMGEYGNHDVGTCPSFQKSKSTSSCSLPKVYNEEVDAPGKYLPGCNPISDTNPAPIYAVAPLNQATDQCDKSSGDDSAPSEPSSAPSASAPSASAPSASASAESVPAGSAYDTATSGAGPTMSSPSTGTILATSFVTLTSAYATTGPGYGGNHYGHGHAHVWPTWRAHHRC